MKHTVALLFLYVFATSCAAQEPFERISLLFVGDLMQHQAQIDAARNGKEYNYSDCFKHVKDEISKADIAIANLEVTLAGKPYTGYPMFSAPDEYLHAITDAGFDVLLTANNHCLDRGRKGLERTIQMLDSLKIPYAGTYINQTERDNKYPLLLEKNGYKIALLNYTYGTNGIDPVFPNIVNYIDKEVILKDIQKAHSMKPDVIIACMHWGSEYKSLPDKGQKELADWLIAQGVNHVIGSHPHVLQPMEFRKPSGTLAQNVVVYSLGNFISNMSKYKTDGGAIFKMEFTKFNNIVRVINCGYSLVWVSRPAISGNKNYILYPITGFSDKLNSEETTLLNAFAKDSRDLFDTHNKDIDEYIIMKRILIE